MIFYETSLKIILKFVKNHKSEQSLSFKLSSKLKHFNLAFYQLIQIHVGLVFYIAGQNRQIFIQVGQ